MEYNLHKAAHSVYSIYLHIYLVTKKRRNAISDEMAVRIREVVANICTKNKSELSEFGAEKNHVHLIVDLHPDNNISQFVGSLKSATSNPSCQLKRKHDEKKASMTKRNSYPTVL